MPDRVIEPHSLYLLVPHDGDLPGAVIFGTARSRKGSWLRISMGSMPTALRALDCALAGADGDHSPGAEVDAVAVV